MDAASHVDQLVEGFTLMSRPGEGDEREVFQCELKNQNNLRLTDKKKVSTEKKQKAQTELNELLSCQESPQRKSGGLKTTHCQNQLNPKACC